MCFPLNTVSAVASTGMKKPWAKMRVLQADGLSANPTSTCVGRAGWPSAAVALPVRMDKWPVKCSWRPGPRGAREHHHGCYHLSQPGAQQASTLPLSKAGSSRPSSRTILSFLSITAALRESGRGVQGWRAVCRPLSLLAGTLVSESGRSDASSSSDLRLPAPWAAAEGSQADQEQHFPVPSTPPGPGRCRRAPLAQPHPAPVPRALAGRPAAVMHSWEQELGHGMLPGDTAHNKSIHLLLVKNYCRGRG